MPYHNGSSVSFLNHFSCHLPRLSGCRRILPPTQREQDEMDAKAYSEYVKELQQRQLEEAEKRYRFHKKELQFYNEHVAAQQAISYQQFSLDVRRSQVLFVNDRKVNYKYYRHEFQEMSPTEHEERKWASYEQFLMHHGYRFPEKEKLITYAGFECHCRESTAFTILMAREREEFQELCEYQKRDKHQSWLREIENAPPATEFPLGIDFSVDLNWLCDQSGKGADDYVGDDYDYGDDVLARLKDEVVQVKQEAVDEEYPLL